MAVDEPRNGDRAHGVDDLRPSGRLEIPADRDDPLPLNQDVSRCQVADARIHSHDGPASQEDVLIRVDALACRGLQAAGILSGRLTLFRPQLQNRPC